MVDPKLACDGHRQSKMRGQAERTTLLPDRQHVLRRVTEISFRELGCSGRRI